MLIHVNSIFKSKSKTLTITKKTENSSLLSSDTIGSEKLKDYLVRTDISLQKINLTVSEEVQLLSNITMSISSGHFTAIFGPSGILLISLLPNYYYYCLLYPFTIYYSLLLSITHYYYLLLSITITNLFLIYLLIAHYCYL